MELLKPPCPNSTLMLVELIYQFLIAIIRLLFMKAEALEYDKCLICCYLLENLHSFIV